MLSYILIVALVNIGLGFAMGVYLGHRHHAMLRPSAASGGPPPQDSLAAALADVQADLGQESPTTAATVEQVAFQDTSLVVEQSAS
jgi:hypothetical protein